MTTKLVNVRLPEHLYAEGREIVDSAGYANFQELVKYALRHTITEIKKEQALINLEKSFGSTRRKAKKQFNSEIKNKIAEELVKNLHKQGETFKRAGL